ncbi:MAG TPA: pyridoxamine 5'-phosphate oxidase family protein [Bacillota bacterium]|nr:pyridoxamine 5'-phosphate oxidase family protein [Bacillota bacterium]
MDVDVEQVVREFIDKTVHLSLATTTGTAPWVCEVHFAYDDNLNLYYRSLSSRRHSREIAANPHVAGNIIDKYEVGASVTCVYFEGAAELLSAGPAQDLAAQCITARLGVQTDIVEEASRPEGHQFYKISVANWYVFGRFGGDKGQKYQLAWNAGSK